jgi:hypothetical protein
MDTKTKHKINRKLYDMTFNTYFDSIPLDTITAILAESTVDIVDEAGNKWEGLLLGRSSNTTFALRECTKILRCVLWLSWYRMPSGRYEIVVYVS